MVKPKGLGDFLAEDKSLTEKMTLQELEGGKACDRSDVSIEEAYDSYKRVLETLNS